MSVVIPVGTVLAAWHFEMSGDSGDVVFTIGFDLDGFEPAADLAENLFNAFPDSGAMARMSDSTVLYEVTLEGPLGNVQTFNDENAGGEAGLSMPPNVANIVKKRTATPGREFRGRFYTPPLRSAYYTSAGIMEATAFAAWNTSMDDFLTAINALDGHATLLHTDPGTGPTEITSFEAEAKLGTQRRRLRD